MLLGDGRYCVFPMRCEGEGRVRTGYEGLSITPVVREAVFEQMSKPAPRTDCDADVARHGESKPMAKQQRTNSPASDTSSGYSRCVVRALKRRAQSEEPARQVHENMQNASEKRKRSSSEPALTWRLPYCFNRWLGGLTKYQDLERSCGSR